MCGISGLYDFSGFAVSECNMISERFRKKLHKRGPDANGEFLSDHILLTHTRLSIIDTSERAAQPMKSSDGSCVIVFNGEIFNFKQLRKELEGKGCVFKSDSDTEVVLQLYMHEGIDFLEKLNGFFALAIYDTVKQQLVVARDRFGIKPLLFSYTEDRFAFSSEMKALLEAIGPQEIDHASLRMYFRLTYIPPPYSIFKNVHKLNPGCFLLVSKNGVEKRCFASIDRIRYKPDPSNDYPAACKELYRLMDDSVTGQLISDVPIGCFLSGGIDSSVVTALASKHMSGLKTFSIGFKDEPYYDETNFAQLVAEKHKTDHTVFSLTNDDLFEAVDGMMDYIDEPFADSSALAVYVLSRETRKHVTVALSGDGADEMFGGYNKHVGEYRIRRKLFSDLLMRPAGFILSPFPASRSSRMGDLVRKIRKYNTARIFSPADRYRMLSSFTAETDIERLLISYGLHPEFVDRWDAIALEIESDSKGIEDVLLSDMNMVLSGDMLPKVDMMSMANSLEVRPPFLDNKVVDFAFSLPTSFKIKGSVNKKIIRDAFSAELPEQVLNRNKHGFEVPMNTWFKTEMRPMIDRYLQSSDFVGNQKLFRHDVIRNIVDKVLHSEQHDYQAFVWSLLVFQHWYEQYESYIKKDWI